MIKRALALLVVFTVVFMCGCGDKDVLNGSDVLDEVILERYNGAKRDICPEELRKYLSLTDEDEQADYLEANLAKNFDYQDLRLKWNGTGSDAYIVYISEDESFADGFSAVTKNTSFNFGTLEPGKTYYWKVVDSEGRSSAVDSFATEDLPIRVIMAEGSYNIRDIGGWKTKDGRRIRYGLLFRGGMLDGLTERGKEQMRGELGIKTELDLRSPSDDHGQTECVFGKKLNYVKVSFSQYSYIIPEFRQEPPKMRRYNAYAPIAIKKIFDVLSDENNYPIYYHCNAGADRTGTLTFLINGLLGVGFDDLTRDFETTSFSAYGKRWRSAIEDGVFLSNGIMEDDENNFVAWNEMYSLMVGHYAGKDVNLSSAIENYLKSVCGVTQEQINKIKNIMTENYQ